MAPSGLNEIQGAGSLAHNNQKTECIIESSSLRAEESSGVSASVNTHSGPKHWIECETFWTSQAWQGAVQF